MIGHTQIASVQRFGEKYVYTYAIYLSEFYMNKSDSKSSMVLVDNCVDVRNWLDIQGMRNVQRRVLEVVNTQD
jgi:hypothetical protein